MGNLSVQASSELELDSDRDISYRNGGITEKSGSSGLLSAAAASMGGLAAATVRRSSFQGCGNGNSTSNGRSNPQQKSLEGIAMPILQKMAGAGGMPGGMPGGMGGMPGGMPDMGGMGGMPDMGG